MSTFVRMRGHLVGLALALSAAACTQHVVVEHGDALGTTEDQVLDSAELGESGDEGVLEQPLVSRPLLRGDPSATPQSGPHPDPWNSGPHPDPWIGEVSSSSSGGTGTPGASTGTGTTTSSSSSSGSPGTK